ncbi:hypothetical protein ACOSP7_004249 [Xanthoceras sorbifolium]
MGCTEELMVTYSAFLLKDRAKDWWKALQRRHPEGITWVDFQREFKDRFYHNSYKDAQIEEFFKPEQGSILVAEYEKKFSDLIRAVPFIADNEEQKVNRFAVGRNPKIRAYVSSAAHTQFGSLVEAATRVERSMEAIPKPKKQKRGWTGKQSSQASIKLPIGFRGTRDSRRRFSICNKCEKSHLGECQKGNTGCYRCRHEGHFCKNCLNVRSSSRSENRSQASGYTSGGRGQQRGQPSGGAGRVGPLRGQPGRLHAYAHVFAVTQQEADATLSTKNLQDSYSHSRSHSGNGKGLP